MPSYSFYDRGRLTCPNDKYFLRARHHYRGDDIDFECLTALQRILEATYELSAEQIARKGEDIISRYGEEFARKNAGSFVAVTVPSGEIIAIKKSLDELNSTLSHSKFIGDCYVSKIGSPAIGEISL